MGSVTPASLPSPLRTVHAAAAAVVSGATAIMVTGGTAYLAVSCTTQYSSTFQFTDYGSYIFKNTDLNALSCAWQYYSGPC